jgi:hypothetical protein
MQVIGLIGPHAVGKTTALRRYGDRLGVYPLDDLREQYPDNAAKAALVAELREGPTVGVIESARGFSGFLSAFRPDDHVIALVCPEPVGRAWLVERRGGRPLSGYWTERRLSYECDRHIRNWHDRLPSSKLFTVTDRARDWMEIDAYFAAIFRRLHNAALRRRAVVL